VLTWLNCPTFVGQFTLQSFFASCYD
jgi:hypothetical protein